MSGRYPVFLSLGILILAGCMASESDGAPATGPSAAVDFGGNATFDEATGSVHGLVLTEELFPIEGANVSFLEIDPPLWVTTDASGRFAFAFLEPGDYLMQVDAVGFEEAVQRVYVRAGESTEAGAILAAKPSEVPYDELLIFEGFWFCGFQYMAAGLYCAPLNTIVFNVTVADGWNHTHYEQHVETGAGLMTSDRANVFVTAYNGSDASDRWSIERFIDDLPLVLDIFPGYEGYQDSQAVGLTTPVPMPADPERLEYTTFPQGAFQEETQLIYPDTYTTYNQGVGATLQTRFTVYSTQFYYGGMPVAYSPLPDA